MLDWLIKGGRVIDGSGSPWFMADVAVVDGRIVDVRPGIDEPAENVLNAGGRVVIPGVIDVHSHTDRTIRDNPSAETAVRQGITTQAIGTCGSSPVPGEQTDAFAEFFAELREIGIGMNAVPFIGHGSVRTRVMGTEGGGGERPVPTAEELGEMCELVAEAMRDGCFGMTTGLQYPPGRNASTEEVVELMKSAVPALYMNHMRDQQSGIRDGVAETISIARESGCRTIISHLKMPREQWGWSGSILEILEDARDEGLEVYCDVYPWEYSGIGLLHRKVLPPWVYADGIDAMVSLLEDPAVRDRIRDDITSGLPGWTNSVAVRGWSNHTITYSLLEGLHHRSIGDLAEETGKDPLDVACEIIIHDRGRTRSCGNTMNDEDIRRILAHPLSMVSTDSYALDGMPEEAVHPRGLGTYPRLFGHYVRQEEVLSLEEAVRKCTSLPASALGLSDRGLIKSGLCADLVVMDPARVGYPGDYPDPLHFPQGIDLTMVGGCAVFRDGQVTGCRSGGVLGGWRQG